MTDLLQIHEWLRAAVAGDVRAVSQLAQLEQQQLLEAARGAGALTLTRAGVVRALLGYENRLFTDVELQRWAWFVSRGYIPGLPCGPVSAIDIEYERKGEVSIAVVVGRVTELGDAIDGAIDAAELAALRFRLT